MSTMRRVCDVLLGLGLVVGAPAGIAHAEGGASVTGKVVFEGTPPTPEAINFGAEKQCSLMHTTAPHREELVVNSNNTLRWVLVYVKGEVPGTYPAPTAPAKMNQTGCMFAPHVLAARVGQPIEFQNGDALLHNVRGVSKQSQGFNVAQPVQGMKATKTLQKPEIGMQLKCDVHYWMVAYLHVLPHPFFAVTGEDGSFTLNGLPDGTYTIEAWHEKLGAQTQTVTVKGGEAAPVTFRFQST